MRKMTVEVCLKDPLMGMPPDAEDLNRAINDLLDRVESVRVIELLKMNFERGEETVVAEITMKAGYTVNGLEFPEILGSLEVLKTGGRSRTSHLRCSNSAPETLLGFSSSDSNEPSHPEGTSFFGAPAPAPRPVATCTCLMRYAIRDEFLLEKMREFDMDVIWTSPCYKSRDLFIHTCIGDAENLNKVLRLMSTYGEVRNVIFEEATFSGNDPLSRLTPRQRDLLIAAKRYGYYEYPRRINSQQLAEKVGISKATAIEHLRKAEARLISTLLAGY